MPIYVSSQVSVQQNTSGFVEPLLADYVFLFFCLFYK